MIRMLLADDQRIVREGLKQLLSMSSGIAVLAEAGNGSEIVAALGRERVDVVMMEWFTAGLGGEELIARIKAIDERIAVLILTTHNDPQVVKRALKAGALGFLTKGCDPATLTNAIASVAAGEHFIAPDVAGKMAYVLVMGDERKPHDLLSDRELFVMQGLVRGMSLHDIARKLYVSHKTVATYKARLLRKMGMRSNADLVRYSLQQGLAD